MSLTSAFYTQEIWDEATEIAKEHAQNFKPSYYTGDDFVPHDWVISAVAAALLTN